MKTIYFKKLRSGNYVSTESQFGNYTVKCRSKKSVISFFAMLKNESTKTRDNFYKRFKEARVIKATYSQSQTYYNGADEFLKSIKK